MPLRLGRSGEAGGRDSLGKAREDRRGIAWPTRAGELAETPSQFPTPKPHPAYVGPGDIGGGDQEWQVRGAIQEEQERSGG